ncbi:MAG TPA: sialidase family protein [Janthinobacterium sp.]|nr:sialidase family protein [Janthinobacterium sp.]
MRWDGATEIATGRGEKGPWQQNDSRYDYVDDPAVAIDAGGAIAVAWADQKSKDVFFRKYSRDGEHEGTAINVSHSPDTFSWLPRLAAAPDNPNTIFMLWQEIIFSGGSHGGDILFARSEDGGASFSAPLNLSNSIGGDGKGRLKREVWSNGSLDLAIGADGAVLAAWTEYHGALWFARSDDKGKTFSPPRQVAGSHAQPARGPSLAIGPNRTVYLAWTVGELAAAAIRVTQSADGGAIFGAPVLVGAGTGYADAPKLAVDAGGALHLVYAESDSGPFGRYRIRYAQSAGGALKFSAPRDIAPAATGAGAGYPSLAIDGGGRLCAIWEVFPDASPHPRGLAFTVSSDHGRSFAPPAMVPGSQDPAGGSNGSHQGLLAKKLALDRDGRIAIVNSSLKQDERSRVWLMRGQLPR